MSTKTVQYCVVGVWFDDYKVLCDSDNDDEFEKYEDYDDGPYNNTKNKDKIGIIADGMNGSYCVIGKILEKSDEYGDGFSSVRMNSKELTKLSKETFKKIKECFGKDLEEKGVEIKLDNIQLLVFTHYS